MLHEFIDLNRDAIIARTRDRVRSRPWPSVAPGELEHGVPLFLTQLAETLRSGDDVGTLSRRRDRCGRRPPRTGSAPIGLYCHGECGRCRPHPVQQQITADAGERDRTFRTAQTRGFLGVTMQITDLRDVMPKSGVSRGARRNRGSARTATLPNALEGQIEEICRDIAVQAKRMRQLQEQADELRTAFRQWAGASGTD